MIHSNIKNFKFPNINNVNDAYNFLINKFQSNKVKIKEINNNLNIILEIIPNIILILPTNKNNMIINSKNRNNSAKNNEKLKNNDNSSVNPEKLKFNTILIKDSFYLRKTNRFNKLIETKFIPTMTVFNSIGINLSYIVYVNNTTNIIF